MKYIEHVEVVFEMSNSAVTKLETHSYRDKSVLMKASVI